MIAIIDYDAGNTFNVQKALQHIGLDAVLTADRDTILAADGVILPGVGAYASAVSVLRERGLIDVIHEVVERNIPLLGICLGMQLLFDESEEYGPTPGLGIIPGTVKAIPNNLGLREVISNGRPKVVDMTGAVRTSFRGPAATTAPPRSASACVKPTGISSR